MDADGKNELAKHGGDLRTLAARAGRSPVDVLDFSASINPLGPPGWLREVVDAHLGEIAHYPDPHCREFVAAVCEKYPVAPAEVVVGNGSTELLYLLPRAFPAKRVVTLEPGYVDYARAAQVAGLPLERVMLREDRLFALELDDLEDRLEAADLVIVGRPNNPTGGACEAHALRSLARRRPDCWFAADEAFADFMAWPDTLIEDRPENLIVVRSLTKFYAIPGLRLGYAVADEAVATQARSFVLPWSVNSLSQAVGTAALRDKAYAQAARQYVSTQKARLSAELGDMRGLTVFPSQANFLLVRVEREGFDAHQLARQLLEDGIAIRTCDDFHGLDRRYFRVAVRTEADHARLVGSLRVVLGESDARPA
jgi:L-threonine-O-3-phosphate decarboxylase